MALLPLATALCALAAPQTSTLEVGRWQVIGPFRSAQAPSTNTRLGPETEVATMQVDLPWPALLQTYPRRTGGEVRWRPADLSVGARLAAVDPLAADVEEIGDLLPEIDAEELRTRGNAVYLYRPIDASDSKEVDIRYGADGGLRMWLNGRQVAKDDKPRRFDGWSDRATLKLQRGRNHLLVKLVHRDAPWRFSMGSDSEVAERVWLELRTGADGLAHPEGQRVHAVIESGIEHLLHLDATDPDHARGYRQTYPGGLDAMTAYTLMKCGVPATHLKVQEALDLLGLETEGTYSVALQVMALAMAGRDKDRSTLARLTRWLIDKQANSGLWGYPSGGPDLSNTQYAALGLKAAAEAGVKIPDQVWERMTQGVLACRAAVAQRSGTATSMGFGYSTNARGASMTMTAAGVATLVLCMPHLDDERLRERAEDAVDRGLVALGDGERLLTSAGYGLYSLERVGGYTGHEELGGRAWYPRGLEILLPGIEKMGWAEWSAKRGYGTELETCYTLLFLRRASQAKSVLARPVTSNGAPGREAMLWKSDPAAGALVLRVSLQGEPSMWLDATSAAFSDLERVVYWLKPPDGNWTRIDQTDGERWAARLTLDRPGIWQVRASGFLGDGKTAASGILEIPFQVESASAEGEAGDR